MTVFTSEDAKMGPHSADIKYLYDDSLFEIERTHTSTGIENNVDSSRYSGYQENKKDGTLAPSRELVQGLQDLPTILKTYKHPKENSRKKTAINYKKQSSNNNNPISVEEIILINERNLRNRENPIPVLPTEEVGEFFVKKASASTATQSDKLERSVAATKTPAQKEVKLDLLSDGKSDINGVSFTVHDHPSALAKKQTSNLKFANDGTTVHVGRKHLGGCPNSKRVPEAQSDAAQCHCKPVGPSGALPPSVPPPPPDTPPGFVMKTTVHPDSEKLAQELYETFCGSVGINQQARREDSPKLCETSRPPSIQAKNEQYSMEAARLPRDRKGPSNRANTQGGSTKPGEYLILNRGLKDRVEEYNEFLAMQRMRAKKRQGRRAAAMIQRAKQVPDPTLDGAVPSATSATSTTTTSDLFQRLNTGLNSVDRPPSLLSEGQRTGISTVASPNKTENLSFSHYKRVSKLGVPQGTVAETVPLEDMTTPRSKTQQSPRNNDTQNIVIASPLEYIEEEDTTTRVGLGARPRISSVDMPTILGSESTETNGTEVKELTKRIKDLEGIVGILSKEIDALKRASPVYRATAKKFVVRNVSSRDL